MAGDAEMLVAPAPAGHPVGFKLILGDRRDLRLGRTGSGSAPNALTEGFQIAFLGGAMIAARGVVATLVLIRTRNSKAHVEMSDEQAATAAA